jgi:hypothetical protein
MRRPAGGERESATLREWSAATPHTVNGGRGEVNCAGSQLPGGHGMSCHSSESPECGPVISPMRGTGREGAGGGDPH